MCRLFDCHYDVESFNAPYAQDESDLPIIMHLIDNEVRENLGIPYTYRTPMQACMACVSVPVCHPPHFNRDSPMSTINAVI